MSSVNLLWLVFGLIVTTALVVDLGVVNRRPHQSNLKEAGVWCAVWFLLALVYAGGVFILRGSAAGTQFLAGYIIELSLSADNVFLFAVIFAYFSVPVVHQHRVLFWGVFSAFVLRGLMILAGVTLVHRFAWITLFFGVLLIYTGIRMLQRRHEEPDISQSPALKLLKRLLPISDEYDGHAFLTRKAGKIVGTPLLLVLLLVEVTDVIFAIDSIPAVLAVTTDMEIVFTSNILAIMGLRSLYFLLSGLMRMFHYLSTGISFILVFVGAKMLLSHIEVHITTGLSLSVIMAILAISILASIQRSRRLAFLEELQEREKVVDD